VPDVRRGVDVVDRRGDEVGLHFRRFYGGLSPRPPWPGARAPRARLAHAVDRHARPWRRSRRLAARAPSTSASRGAWRRGYRVGR
jgi:hypothetical protein